MLFDAVKKYATFHGNAPRKEYWGFILFSLIAGVVVGLVEGVSGTGNELGYGPLSVILMLGLIIPWFAVMARRLNDAGWTKWTMLLLLVPGINLIYQIVVGCVATKEEA